MDVAEQITVEHLGLIRSAGPQPKERTIAIAELRSELTEVVRSARRYATRTVVTKYGKPIAALVGIRDLQLLRSFDDAHERIGVFEKSV